MRPALKNTWNRTLTTAHLDGLGERRCDVFETLPIRPQNKTQGGRRSAIPSHSKLGTHQAKHHRGKLSQMESARRGNSSSTDSKTAERREQARIKPTKLIWIRLLRHRLPSGKKRFRQNAYDFQLLPYSAAGWRMCFVPFSNHVEGLGFGWGKWRWFRKGCFQWVD